MKLTVVVGRSGSGKSAYIRQRITASPRKAFLLVPDQYTYEAERSFGETGLFYAEVLGFSQFSHRVFAAAGGAAQSFLDADGRRMALSLCIEECRGELSVYAGCGRPFAEKAGQLITTLKLGGVGAADLRSAAERATGLLRHKLRDISIIFDRFSLSLAGRYIDSEDANALLIEKIPAAAFLSGADVYVDNVLRFEKQRLLIMKALLGAVDCLTIAVQAAGDSPPDLSDFMQIAQESGAEMTVVTPSPELARPSCPAAAALERELFRRPGAHPGKATLFRAASPEQEAANACAHIHTLLRKGARQGEITLVAPEAYNAPLRRSLELYGIDYFMDSRRPFASIPAVVFVLAALRAARNGMKSEDMLLLAKSGYITDCGSAELLENFLLRTGQKRLPGKPFTDAPEKIETARALLAGKLLPFAAALSTAKSARDCAQAVFDFMVRCKLREQLRAGCASMRENGEHEYAAETEQAWKAMLKLLDQAVLLGPDSPREFVATLAEGLSSHQTAIVPQLDDHVEVTQLSHACQRGIKHLVLLGANDGELPASVSAADMLNDADISQMVNLGVTAFLPSLEKLRQAKQEVYSLLSRPTESVYISCTSSNSLRPSPLWPSLCTMFGESPAVPGDRAPEEGMRLLIPRLVGIANGQVPTGADAQWLKSEYAYQRARNPERLRAIETRLIGDVSSIPAALAGAVYGGGTTSCSRLETFNQCPFKHFVQYGLRPERRQEFKETALDAGSFYHEVFDKFFKSAVDNGQNFALMTREECYALADEIIDALIQTHNGGVLSSGRRMAFVADAMRGKARRTLWAAVRQIGAGSFLPVLSEAELGKDLPFIELDLPGGQKLLLRGKVDRIDVSRRDNLVRVIDYKSGSNDFSYAELLAGSQLQLPLYTLAAKALGDPCGMFYMRVGDPVTESGSEDDVQKQFRLRGVMLSDPPALRAMDAYSSGHSAFVPAQFKADGTAAQSRSMLESAQMNRLLGYALEKARQSAIGIYSGDIAACPAAHGSRIACSSCDYGGICGFDAQTGAYRAIPQIGKREFLERMEDGDALDA